MSDPDRLMVNPLFRARFEEAAITNELFQRMHAQEGQSTLDFCRMLPQYTAPQIMQSLMHLYKYDLIAPCDESETN